MNAQNNPAENVPDAGIGRDNTRWRLILLVLCAVGTGLVVGILALQVTEYLFYKASPDVWPQSGAGRMVGAPATFMDPVPVTTAPAGVEGSAIPPAAAPVALPSADVTSSGVTSMPAAAATSAPAPVAATP